MSWLSAFRWVGAFAGRCWLPAVVAWGGLIAAQEPVSGKPAGGEYPEDRRGYPALFEAAAREFGVPADVLKGVAFAETRWSHLRWAPGDVAACNGMPRPHGIMSLWDDPHFGRSLREAAEVLRQPVAALQDDPATNIRGGAALLRRWRDRLPLPEGTTWDDLESWRNAIAAYCGIPQEDLAQQHALDVYAFVQRGYHQHGIEWPGRPVRLAAVREAVRRVQAEARAKRNARGRAERDELQGTRPADAGRTDPLDGTADLAGVRTEGGEESVVLAAAGAPSGPPDYPGAIWRPAYPGHWYESGNGRHFVVIHDMEGYYLSTISYFQSSNTQASAHYCINGLRDTAADAPAGEITQMVDERHWAWHARCLNTWSFGIEHEGFANNPAWYTEEQYQASAALTRHLCDRYGIPKDRNHIIAHGEWQNAAWRQWMATAYPAIDAGCNNHTDPGPNWAWSRYMGLVLATNPPSIVTAPQGQVRNPGETAVFSVAAAGSAPLRYQWLRNGQEIPGATNTQWRIVGVQLADAGDYVVIVRNGAGSVSSEPAALTVTAPAGPVGTGSGLLGAYFDAPNFVAPRFSRVDATVNFNWGSGGPASVMGDDSFSIRWVGEVEARYTQRHTFYLRCDDAARLWVDGRLLIDRWASQGVVESRGEVDLVAGRRHSIRLEYMDVAGDALAELRWSSASQVKQVIPRTQLHAPRLSVQGPGPMVSEGGRSVTGRVRAEDPDPAAGAIEWLEAFDDVPQESAPGTALFGVPGSEGMTAEFLEAGSGDSIVVSNAPAGGGAGRMLRGTWSWRTGFPGAWLRWSTADAVRWPNPRLDVGQGVEFELWTDRRLGVALGVREVSSLGALGEDGGLEGPVEWVGATGLEAGRPIPSRWVAGGTWTTLRFNLPQEPAVAFTGDGALPVEGGAGVLDHLALVPGDGAGRYTVYIDTVRWVRANTVTFSLGSGAPGGVDVNARTGVVTWRPGPDDSVGTNGVLVRASNRSIPSLTAEVAIPLELREPPRASIRPWQGGWELRWASVAGRRYRVQATGSLTSPAWEDVGPLMEAGGDETVFWTDGTSGGTRFYRVLPE